MSAVFTHMINNFFNGYHNSVVHKDQVLPECSLEFFSLFVESRVWVRKVEGIIRFYSTLYKLFIAIEFGRNLLFKWSVSVLRIFKEHFTDNEINTPVT